MDKERKSDGTFAEGHKVNVKAKIWSDVLRKHSVQNPEELMAVAKALFDKAKEGDVSAAKEIGDRLEGKVAQRIEGTGDGGEFTISLIKRVIVDSSPDSNT